MSPASRRSASCGAVLAAALAALPACSVTWRQPTIAPIDPVRVYAVDGARACEAASTALAALRLQPRETMRGEAACVLETDYRRLDDPDDPFESLRDVGYVRGGLSAGRYLLTATIREDARGYARVRLAARIEGYDTSWVTVRSNGTIERTAFERLSEVLGVDPLDDPGTDRSR